MSDLIADKLAIQELAYEYARCADQKDYAGFANVFTQDGVLSIPAMQFDAEGLEVIQGAMQQLENYSRTFHLVANVQSTVDNDKATAQVYCVASHVIAGDDGEQKFDIGVIYDDKLVKTSEGWRFSKRTLNSQWSQTQPLDQVS
ncbi:nuclear transport factor 2 family protein [Endozoicomonas sp. OPT23]|uniref:nuclear transport factor 2 family protein n=1 Tax=Endozoicomonas sp. OPT23 TaxID=2072845 RepID=UPI00129AEDF7|nr:nuclear transport factor 2 family protein [Endozoicomonas sp. OPT23]